MFVLITPAQRDIVKIALVNQKKLATDAYSLLRRLGKSEKPALEAQGTIEYLVDSFDKMNIGARDDKKWELPHPDAAKQLRSALGNWARQALQRSEAAQQLSLTTNVNKAESEAQALLTQLNDQLSLPLIDINAFVEEVEAKPEKEKDIAKDTGVSNAPTLGRRTSAAGKVPLALMDDGKANDRSAKPAKKK
jgi:hypothetical protein